MPDFLPSLAQCACRAYRRFYRLAFLCFVFGFGFGIGSSTSIAQPQQIRITNPEADSVLLGTYNPARYGTSVMPKDIGGILKNMATEISRDSLESYLKQVVTFYNRNTGSDTLSNTRGMGAARRWAFKKFQDFSAKNNGRMLVTYLQFNQAVCGMNQHRNVLAVLPGQDTKNHALVVVEAHLDTRCETGCDITCKSEGADDNGAGVALVLEAARVLSKYQFQHTLVFMLTTGEEQGLYGGAAMAKYSKDHGISIRSVQNNDVVGGIVCGPTSSPPGCQIPNSIDSNHVRIFSAAINFSMNKALGRFIKGQYEQWIKPTAKVPMEIVLMDPIDRTGRGGDHQPFSDLGYAAIRFTESFEYGNGNSNPEQGRQHTVLDVIGRDTNGDGVFDSLFVDYNYLHRNTLINAVGLVGAASGPQAPEFDTATAAKGYISISLKTATSLPGIYKVAVRTNSNDFAVVYTVSDTASFILPSTKTGTTYYLAVASVDAAGAQSLYSQEKAILAKVDGPPVSISAFHPHDTHGHTAWRLSPTSIFMDHISWTILGDSKKSARSLVLCIADAKGRTLRSQTFPFQGVGQILEVTLYSKTIPPGTYQVTLQADGKYVSAQTLNIPNQIKIR